MGTLKKSTPRTEKELHTIIENELDALEEGLNLLKYEFSLTKGRPDFLCVDSGGRLVIIEVKLHEDENILFQALGYYAEIDGQRYAIATMFPDRRIDPAQDPRVILIAGRFSDSIRKLSTLVIPEVELYEFAVLVTSHQETGIYYHPVSLPKIEQSPSKPATIQELREYITKDTLKPVFDKLIQDVRNIGEGIQAYATQSYVGFKYRGRVLAVLAPRRKSFDFAAAMVEQGADGGEYETVRIETANEDYTDIVERVKISFRSMDAIAETEA